MEGKDYNESVDKVSDILKAISHPTRFCIVCKLTRHPLNVTQMQSCLDASQANVSQHLAILRTKKIVKCQRQGNEIYYSLSNNKIQKLVELFFDEGEIPE